MENKQILPKKSGEWTITKNSKKTGTATGLGRTRRTRGNQKEESNYSPKIPDVRGISDIHSLTSWENVTVPVHPNYHISTSIYLVDGGQ